MPHATFRPVLTALAPCNSCRVTGRRRFLAAAGASLALQGMELLLGACGGSTSGELIEFTTRARIDQQRWTNAYDWDVELSQVRIALASLHLFDAREAAVSKRIRFIRTAWAHPGHLQEDGIVGEMIDPEVVELLEQPSRLAAGRGLAGPVESGHVQFDPEALDGWAVWLEGKARKGDEIRWFRARAAAPELESVHGDAEIFDCPVDAHELTGDGVVELVASPMAWLSDVDFAMQPAIETRRDLDAVAGPHAAFVAGLRQPGAWRFHVEPG
jgi:hypothetical protein